MDSHSASHFTQGMQSSDGHYGQQQQQQQTQPQSQPQQQPQWSAGPHLPHLLQPGHGQSPFASPATPSSQLTDQQYSGYYHGQSGQSNLNDNLERTSSSLSLNLSSLTVTSPTNLSPINPSSHPSSASTLSPVTPLSPTSTSTTPQQHAFPTPSHRHMPTFAYAPPDQGIRYDQTLYDGQYDISTRRPTASSRSSSSSEKSVPRKRSFTAATPLAVSVEENMYENGTGPQDLSTPASYDDVDMGYGLDSQGSPVDGSTSSGEHEDQLKPLESQMSNSSGSMPGMPQGSVNILGKANGTNNFVTKLYQMINDAKSSHFISWTELGTSFVVSNVGEFSRSILGSHFKHNNFSSFVRQLNMYGFHKINRTPRAQRMSTDAQTWEFSHHKFLRGRPDLLDEIKRKALEPDPSIKHRVELPGEVAAQLNQMREQNRRVVKALDAERAKVDRLTSVTKTLFDIVSKAFPGSLPGFPSDLLDSIENPPIFITSPSSAAPNSHYPPAMSLSNHSLHSLHSLSPGSSPTTADFPSHVHTPHSLSRQQSLQHIPYENAYGHGVSTARYETALQTPLPPSPGPMDSFGAEGDQGRSKRQRTAATMPAPGAEAGSVKRMSRARSDSAPLGYGLGQQWTHGNRPRSGSGLAPRTGRRDDLMLNISSAAMRNGVNAGGPPLLSVSPVSKTPPGQ